ncbi:phage integrase SAM-like domain-containing protein [Sphingobacterium kyonggiense]
MATFTPVIIKHHKKVDGTWNAKIRISQKGKSVYLDTHISVTQSELNSKGQIKPSVQVKKFSALIEECRSVMTNNLHDTGSPANIKLRIIEKRNKSNVELIDFLKVCEKIIEETKEFAAKNSAIPLTTVYNSLVDFVKKNNNGKIRQLSPSEINLQFLKDYERYLRTERQLVRINQFGNQVTTTSKPLSDAGIFKHMTNFRLMFNACKSHYNDEDTGTIIIPHNPFSKYDLRFVRTEVKRSMSIKDLIILYNTTSNTPRETIAKDMFFLSFFLCGMNSVDIYNYNDQLEVVDGRLGYNRSKTMGRRRDAAYISISVPDAASSALAKYRGKLSKRYSSDRTFNKALNLGLRSLAKKAGIGNVTFYFARHTFATIARNECRFGKDDIAEALNHVDSSMRVTDDYITKDWKIIDDVQSAVLKFFFDKLNELS